MPTFTYGGQALIEGVLMRGRDAVAVALRHPDGEIVYATERLDSGFHGTRWSKLPFIRGLVVLYETLVMGTRWLIRSANVQASEEGVELGKGSVAMMLRLTLVAGVGVFFLLPLFIASVTTANIENGFAQHLVEGLVRVAIFLGYLVIIGRSPDIRRVFQYHGVNGYREDRTNVYAFFRQSDGTAVRSRRFDVHEWLGGPLRVDPAPAGTAMGRRCSFPQSPTTRHARGRST